MNDKDKAAPVGEREAFEAWFFCPSNSLLAEWEDAAREAFQAGAAYQRAQQPQSAEADGWKLVPVERITIALESVQNAMEDAYNNAYQECCGRGQGQCCGDPVAAWSDADTAIMDALAPAQRELSALLAAAPSAPKADDPVKVQLLEALELVVQTHDQGGWPTAAITIARAAIAAARKGEGE